MSNHTKEINPKPIGGWLVLYLGIMFMCAAVYLTATITVITNFSSIINNHLILLLISLGTILKLFLSVFILLLFTSKKRYTPKLIIAFEGCCILLRLSAIGDKILRERVISNSNYVSLLFGIISLAWIVYFIKSKRVHDTFIND
jgi:hypothetical protein